MVCKGPLPDFTWAKWLVAVEAGSFSSGDVGGALGGSDYVRRELTGEVRLGTSPRLPRIDHGVKNRSGHALV